jgi:hypothetical protein
MSSARLGIIAVACRLRGGDLDDATFKPRLWRGGLQQRFIASLNSAAKEPSENDDEIYSHCRNMRGFGNRHRSDLREWR